LTECSQNSRVFIKLRGANRIRNNSINPILSANLTVLPAFGYNVTLFDGAAIGLAFTFISLIRSYVIRRVFNYYD